MTIEEFCRLGGLWIPSAETGMREYGGEFSVMDGRTALEFFRKEMEACGPERSFTDFYYFGLDEEARRTADTVLSEEERRYLLEMEMETEWAGPDQLIFPLDPRLLSIAVRLNETEMLFSTFYFIRDGESSAWWGNYGQQYVCFRNKGKFPGI